MPKKKEVVQDETVTLAQALKELCESKGFPREIVIDAVSESLKKAYFKYSGDYPDTIVRVDIDLEAGSIKMFKIKNVVAEIEDDVFETDPEEAYEETGIHYNVGDVIETPIDISLFRRNAAMQAKNVFKQKLREIEKETIFSQFSNKIGEIINGIVESCEESHVSINIGHTRATLKRENMLPNDSFKTGNTITVYVEDVSKTGSSAPISASRTNPKFVTKLMERDIAEISAGIVEIKSISRMPGFRSKVAVSSKDPNIDPSGACIGPRGSRISRVLAELSGEKIDVVNYSDNPLLFVADALKPCQVWGMEMIDEENHMCRAIVPDDQYSLAIGAAAQNVNLAVRLTNWKIDIKSITEAEEQGIVYTTVEDLKVMDQAKRAKVIKPVTPAKVVVPSNEDVVVEPETKVTVKPIVETKVQEEEVPVIKVTPTRKGKTNAFADLEAALNSSQTPTESQPTKKKWTKKTTTDDEEETKTPASKPSVPQNVLPVYTEEELAAIEEEEFEEEEYEEDDINFDDYDDYYDEK